MGNFYTNISLKTSDQQGVIDYLNDHRRHAYVSPVNNGFVCVFDELCDTQEVREIANLGKSLTQHLQCAAIAVLNHDDDVFWYQVYQNGQVVDEYDSSPGYFSGSARPPQMGDTSLLCQLFGLENERHLTRILETRDLFAISTHEALADLLGLPEYSVGLGFNYINRGELDHFLMEQGSFDDGEESDSLTKYGFIETPNAPPSKPKSDPKFEGEKIMSPTLTATNDVLCHPEYSGDKVTPKNAKDVEAYLNRGIKRLLDKDAAAAIEDFTHVLEQRDAYPEAYYARFNRAVARTTTNEISTAIEDLLAALKLKSDCQKTKDLLTKLLSS